MIKSDGSGNVSCDQLFVSSVRGGGVHLVHLVHLVLWNVIVSWRVRKKQDMFLESDGLR